MNEERPIDDVDAEDDALDLTALIAVPWRHRKLIGLGTLGVTLLAVVCSLLIPRVYFSDGFYQLGNPRAREAMKKRDPQPAPTPIPDQTGIPIPLFKTSATQFSNPNRIQTFASHEASLSPAELQETKRVFRTAADINRWIKPVYAYARDDARDFVSGPQDENSVLGLNLTFEARSPEAAAQYVGFLGRYVRDCIIYVTLYKYLMDEHSRASSELSRTDIEALETRFELEQDSFKLRDIQAILSKYPESARIENRQLVSVQDRGYQYLSPVTQSVGIESELAELRRTLARLERTREQMTIRRRYFSRCIEQMRKIGERGEKVMEMLATTRSEVFGEQELKNDAVKQVFHDLLMDMERFDLAFHTNCRFISGPTVPVRHVRPSRVAIVAAALVGSFAFFVCLAFASTWWVKNRQKILAPSPE